MKISELIKTLQEVEKTYGDQEVKLDWSDDIEPKNLIFVSEHLGIDEPDSCQIQNYPY